MNCRQVQTQIDNEWRRLGARYLPHVRPKSIWRYGNTALKDEIVQGWKLHISATILNANDVLKAVAPVLNELQVPFKAPVSMNELMKINAGIYYGYSQVGKFITVYPHEQSKVVELANNLYQRTLPFSSPHVPFDGGFMPNGSVYYRYGAFRNSFAVDSEGVQTPTIRTASGEIIPDDRTITCSAQYGIPNPFRLHPNAAGGTSPLDSKYRIFEALSQRGKGGVYKAYEFGIDPPRLCIVKEGRKDGEVQWDGRDGAWRVKRERLVLSELRCRGLNVPSVIDTFELDGNFYLVTEFINGETLKELLRNKERSIRPTEFLDLAGQLAKLLAMIHSAGWVWRDCKPANLIVSDDGSLRPIDFEGACILAESDPLPWSTPGYSRSGAFYEETTKAEAGDDLFALGSTIRAMLDFAEMDKSLRSNLKTIIDELQDRKPGYEPSAQHIANRIMRLNTASKIYRSRNGSK